MAFLQKKPQTSTSVPLYTLGAIRTILIVGLGNPGREYEGTRHNLGFTVLDYFAEINNFPPWIDKRDLNCQLAISNLGSNRIILCKPSTFINNSGQAVQAVQHFYKLSNSNTLVVYDELALSFGQLRTRSGGSDAGHNGVKSLIAQVGDNFGRLRIGIGSQLANKADAADFVLKKFARDEQPVLPAIIQEAGAMMTEYIFSGTLPHDTRTVT